MEEEESDWTPEFLEEVFKKLDYESSDSEEELELNEQNTRKQKIKALVSTTTH